MSATGRLVPDARTTRGKSRTKSGAIMTNTTPQTMKRTTARQNMTTETEAGQPRQKPIANFVQFVNRKIWEIMIE